MQLLYAVIFNQSQCAQHLFMEIFKGEVHSRMAVYFLHANKKFTQRYVIHQNFSLQRAL